MTKKKRIGKQGSENKESNRNGGSFSTESPEGGDVIFTERVPGISTGVS